MSHDIDGQYEKRIASVCFYLRG